MVFRRDTIVAVRCVAIAEAVQLPREMRSQVQLGNEDQNAGLFSVEDAKHIRNLGTRIRKLRFAKLA
jgi:hypothetical protein